MVTKRSRAKSYLYCQLWPRPLTDFFLFCFVCLFVYLFVLFCFFVHFYGNYDLVFDTFFTSCRIRLLLLLFRSTPNSKIFCSNLRKFQTIVWSATVKVEQLVGFVCLFVCLFCFLFLFCFVLFCFGFFLFVCLFVFFFC